MLIQDKEDPQREEYLRWKLIREKFVIAMIALSIILFFIVFLINLSFRKKELAYKYHALNKDRFHLVIHSQYRRDHHIFDSFTGKIWSNVQYTDIKGQPLVWQVDDKVNSTEELFNWFRQFD